jgi:Methyltransferase FkbM domain
MIYQTFFKDKLRNGTTVGTYVKLGAFNGQEESNSRFFDLCLGWKGLLIEGNPKTFMKMKGNRMSAHRMNFAPSCSEEYEMINKTVEFASYPMANAGLKGKAKTYDLKPMVSVPCGPFGPVLEDIFEGEIINFMSFDVEGAEAMVLRTIDFERVQIDVLMVEVENTFCMTEGCPVRREVRAIMDQLGYLRYKRLVRASDVYVRPGSDFVLKDYPIST